MKLGSDIKQAIESLALEKGVTVESMYEALVSAFRSAYMRIPGAAEEARVTLDPDSGEITVYAQELDNDGNVIKEWEPQISDTDFGRIAAQSFKQMMTTKVRDAKRATVLDAYIGREGELVTGIVTQFDSRFNQTIIDLQDAEAVILHSDRGSQYTSYEYQAFLKEHNVISSMSAVGSCYDNAAMESFFGLLKRERVNRKTYTTRAEARADVFDYIERFYNRKRRHSYNDGLPPVRYAENYSNSLN